MGKLKCNLTPERLREVLNYDPETGLFCRIKAGKTGYVLGWNKCKGYITIGVDGISYMAHRLAWLYVHGKWPDLWIDHINGIKQDNRISNLRDVTHTENCHNRRARRRKDPTMPEGVTQTGLSRFKASIKVDGTPVHLGTFDTKHEAAQEYTRHKASMRPSK